MDIKEFIENKLLTDKDLVINNIQNINMEKLKNEIKIIKGTIKVPFMLVELSTTISG